MKKLSIMLLGVMCMSVFADDSAQATKPAKVCPLRPQWEAVAKYTGLDWTWDQVTAHKYISSLLATVSLAAYLYNTNADVRNKVRGLVGLLEEGK